MVRYKPTNEPAKRQMEGGPRQLANTNRLLNAYRFHKDLAFTTRHRPMWIKCGKLCDGNSRLHKYFMMDVSMEE